MVTHYDTLGVSPDATASEIRAAYLARARALHPDRHAGRDAGDVARSERAMQDVNVAWSVLGDPDARRDYDATLRSVNVAPAAAARQTPWPTVVLDEPRDFGPTLPRLVRIGPIVLILAVLGAIFVFTAFAAGSRSVDVPGRPSGPAGPDVGSCVVIGSSLTRVRCSDSHDARVVAVVMNTTECGNREIPYLLGVGRVACLSPA